MTSDIDRRTFIRRTGYAGAAALALGALEACSGGVPLSGTHSGSQMNEASAGVSKDKPRRGGTLRFGTWSEEPGLNPLVNAWDSNGTLYGSCLFDTLASVTPDAKVIPYLARSISHNSTYTEWTVTLRAGVTFHDGMPLTSAIVVANWQALRRSAIVGYTLVNLAGVTASGSDTVVFRTNEPWVAYDAFLTTAPILHPKMLSANYKGQPIGTGPFVYQSWVPGSHFTLARNPRYWRQGLPYVDRVTFTPITDSQQRENALQAGNVDIITVGSTIDNMPSLAADKTHVYRDDTQNPAFEPSMIYWILNCAAPPTNDVRVRRALAYATDQSQFSDLSFHGAGSAGVSGKGFVPVTGPFPPGSPYFTDTGYPTKPDLAMARKLVKSYAAEHGTPTIKVIAIPERTELIALQLVQSQWGAAGFKVSVSQVEVARLINNALTGDFTAAYWNFGGATDPDQNYPFWSPRSSTPLRSISVKEDRLKDPRIQPLLDKGRSSTDRATRIKAYQDISKLLAEDAPYIYMGRSVGGYVARMAVKNWAGPASPEGTPMFWSSTPCTQSWLA